MITGGPLSGRVVIDLSTLSPGLYCSALLSAMGAMVVGVEAPSQRRQGASLTDLPMYGAERARAEGVHPLHARRESVLIDLKATEGREAFLRMASRADVVIDSFRPGVTERLGIGFEDVSAVSPYILYCSLGGYDRRGEDAHKPGHDLNYLAASGALSMSSRGGTRPGIPINLIGDFAGGGLMAALAISGYLARSNPEGPVKLDVSMVRSICSMLETAVGWMRAGAPDPSWGRGLLTGGCPYYDTYQTKDGKFISVATLEPKFFMELCQALKLEDYEPAYADTARWPRLRSALEDRFLEKDLAEWLTIIPRERTCVAPVLSLHEASDVMQGTSPEWPIAPFDATPAPAEGAAFSLEEFLDECGIESDERAKLGASGIFRMID